MSVRAAIAIAYALLVLGTAMAWAPDLNPPSLWMDDVEGAVLTKLDTLSQLCATKTHYPPAFAAAQWITARLIRDPELGVQAIPFLFALASIPLLGLLAQRLTGSPWLGLVTAALAAMNPTLATYALRAKQYPVEFLCSTLLLLAAFRALEKPGPRNAATAAATVIAGCLLSFTSWLLSALIIPLLILAAWRDPTTRAKRRTVIGIAAAAALVLATLYVADIRHRPNAALETYWKGYFLPLSSAVEAFRVLTSKGWNFVSDAFPIFGKSAGAALALIGFVALWRDRPLRWFAILVTLFFPSLLAANALHLYPLGSPRLDLFAAPVMLALAVLGVHAITRRLRLANIVNIGIAGALVGACLVRPVRPEYPPDVDDARLIALMASSAQPDDAIILHPAGDAAAAYYGPWPIRLSPQPLSPRGLNYEVIRPHLLRASFHAVEAHADVTQLLSERPYPRVWYFAYRVRARAWPWIAERDQEIREAIRDSGYAQDRALAAGGSELILFTRP
jgi:hypothetical protein